MTFIFEEKNVHKIPWGKKLCISGKPLCSNAGLKGRRRRVQCACKFIRTFNEREHKQQRQSWFKWTKNPRRSIPFFLHHKGTGKYDWRDQEKGSRKSWSREIRAEKRGLQQVWCVVCGEKQKNLPNAKTGKSQTSAELFLFLLRHSSTNSERAEGKLTKRDARDRARRARLEMRLGRWLIRTCIKRTSAAAAFALDCLPGPASV